MISYNIISYLGSEVEVVQAPKGTNCRLKMQTKDESCIGSRGRALGTAEAHTGHCWGTLEQGTEPPKTNDSFRVVHNACSYAPEPMNPPWIRWSRKESNKISTFIFMLSQAKTWSSHLQKSLHNLHTAKRPYSQGKGYSCQWQYHRGKRSFWDRNSSTDTRLTAESPHSSSTTTSATVFKQPYEGCRLSCCWACRWKEKWK